MDNSMKSGKCPKCGGNEVYNDDGLNKHNQRGVISFSFMGGFQITSYICASCGYIEEYIGTAYLQNGSLAEGLRKNWKKT